MDKILITGGAGFIGTALANCLRDMHYHVSLADLPDRFSQKHKDFDCIELDIRNNRNFDALEKTKFDCIFHLAAQTSGLISQEEPTLDVDTNVKGTLNVCNFAKKIKASKLIFTSSMAAYGNKRGIIREDAPLNPISNYGVSKKAGESYIETLKQYNIESTIFRLFNVYGPGQNLLNLKQGMASIFMSQAFQSSEIKVTGSFDRYRDFVYIDDVVSALTLGLNSNTDGEIYNVGSGIATTVKQLIDLILDIHGTPSMAIKNIGSHEGDQFGSLSDIKKLKSLSWQPLTDLRTGLTKMHLYAEKTLL